MPDYKDKLNYSAQKAIFENIDWNTLQFDDRRLRSPLTAEEEKQEESYEPWRDRYWSEVDRKYNKWKVDTGSDFLNAIANGVSRFVSGLTSPLTMKDDDVNYKDEITYKINMETQGNYSEYDSYTTSIYQYKYIIDDIAEMLIKDGYYNFNLSDNGKIVDFDDNTYQNLSNQITDKIIPKMMFQKGPSGTLSGFGYVDRVNQPIDTTLYEYGELNEKDKTGLRDAVNSTINQYIRTGYGKLAEKMYSNDVIKRNTEYYIGYWELDKESESASNYINGNSKNYNISFKDPETGERKNMLYSDFIKDNGMLKKEDFIVMYHPRGNIRSYGVKVDKSSTELAVLSLRTDLNLDQALQELGALNYYATNLRDDLFRKGEPTSEMTQVVYDETYNLMLYYLTSGFIEYDHLNVNSEYLDEFNKKGYYPGAEYDDKSEFYHLRRENEGKYNYVVGNIISRFGRSQLNAIGIRDEEDVQEIMSWKFTFHNNAVTTGENKVAANTVTIESGDGQKKNMSIIELVKLFKDIARSDQNNEYKLMSQIDEDEINAGTDYSKFLHSIFGNYIGGSGFSPKDKSKMTDVGFFAAMNGLKRSDGSLYDVYDILMSDGIEYIDTKSENTQYDFQERDLLIFRKRGQKHNVVSIADGNVYTLGNGDNQPQVIPIQDYINIMNTRGYSLYRYRFEGNFNPQTARFNLEEYFNIY